MNYTATKKLMTSLSLLALACTVPALQAENVHLGKDVATSEEIIELLMPSNENLKVRGLRVSEPPEEPRSVSLEVYFAFDSAELTPEAIEQLSPVGEALVSDELGALTFQLEGHTDAVGDEVYNLHLSERRALAVRSFFIEHYGVGGDRLSSTGRGENELLDPQQPDSGVNRRVQIVAQ